MCFEVILAHFWHSSDRNSPFLKPFSYTILWAVPVFMFAAFLLCGQAVIDREHIRNRRRLHRLVMMHVLWAAIYFVFWLAARLAGRGIFADTSIPGMALSLAAQVFLGSTFNATMWFQADLIVITFAMCCLYSKLSGKIAVIITVLGMFAAFGMQYSGLNLRLFGRISYASSKYTFGRICEMLPFACAGILFVKSGVMEKLAKHRSTSIIVSVLCLLALHVLRRNGLLERPEGFGYQGVYLLMCAMCLTVIFWLFPLQALPASMKKIIAGASGLTPGIYCMHMLVVKCMQFAGWEHDSFFWCVEIFAVCMAVAFVLSKAAGRYGKYLVR